MGGDDYSDISSSDDDNFSDSQYHGVRSEDFSPPGEWCVPLLGIEYVVKNFTLKNNYVIKGSVTIW